MSFTATMASIASALGYGGGAAAGASAGTAAGTAAGAGAAAGAGTAAGAGAAGAAGAGLTGAGLTAAGTGGAASGLGATAGAGLGSAAGFGTGATAAGLSALTPQFAGGALSTLPAATAPGMAAGTASFLPSGGLLSGGSLGLTNAAKIGGSMGLLSMPESAGMGGGTITPSLSANTPGANMPGGIEQSINPFTNQSSTLDQATKTIKAMNAIRGLTQKERQQAPNSPAGRPLTAAGEKFSGMSDPEKVAILQELLSRRRGVKPLGLQ